MAQYVLIELSLFLKVLAKSNDLQKKPVFCQQQDRMSAIHDWWVCEKNSVFGQTLLKSRLIKADSFFDQRGCVIDESQSCGVPICYCLFSKQKPTPPSRNFVQ